MAEPFYITTAISYPNGRPHIGHAYEAIAADAIARLRRMQGRDVFFMTGTDEHGLKMAQTAAKRGITAKELADEMSSYFREMDEALNISFDRFIRTTEPAHYEASRAIWRAMQANGDIYLGRYEGWYSVRDEAFYGEDELIEGEGGQKLSPQNTPVEWTVEESWFFRLSAYADRLIALYESNPDFIRPESRRNEVMSFVKGGLADLSISRTSFDWGVPVPDAPGHVMYVWVDALTNYLTGAGYPGQGGAGFGRWPADLHIIGKDIVRFHAVYWPAFLMSAGLDLPKQVFGHGFLLNRGEKMSKSVGNVVDPMELVETYGADRLRYFLLSDVTFGSDGSFSDWAIIEKANADLANSYGNLIQRVVAFVSRRLNGDAPELLEGSHPLDRELDIAIGKAFAHYDAAMGNLELSRGAGACMMAVFAMNKYVDDAAPWSLVKTDEALGKHVLANLLIKLAQVSLWLKPFIPETAEKALDILKVPANFRNDYVAPIQEWYQENWQTINFPAPTPLVAKIELA